MRIFVGALLLAGCGLSAPATVDSEGDVARARFELRARHTDVLPVDVFLPALGSSEARPALVFIQGGAVPSEAYHWLARGLARRGFVVAVPEVYSKLAIFSVEDGEYVRRLLVDPPAGSVLEGAVNPERVAVGGHSLGGVVAAKLAREEFAALILHASYSDAADDEALRERALPTLLLAGSLDCSAPPEKTREGFERLASPAALVSLEGVTHYQFTSSEEVDLRRGCDPALELEAAHERIVAGTAAFLEGALVRGTVPVAELQGVPGATVVSK